MLSMRELSRVYRTDTVETTALDGIFLDVADGEFVAVMGPSGCGKSTLAQRDRHARFARPAAPTSSTAPRWPAFPNRSWPISASGTSASSSSRFNLVDELSVRENIELALLYHNVPAGERRTRVDEVMDKVGIAHRAKHRPSQLSGGQQQRVAVARALVASPKLILADEPTGNLDTAHGEEVMKMLQALNGEGSTIVMVTHSPAHADYAGRVVNMLDGRILVEHRRAA